MNTKEQQERRTAVQRLEADFERTKADLETVLLAHTRAQDQTHRAFVAAYQQDIKNQTAELQAFQDAQTRALAEARKEIDQAVAAAVEPLKRGFWGHWKFILTGR